MTMLWKGLSAVLVAAAVAPAQAETVASTIAEFGLVGTWASDCTKPASNHNYLTTIVINENGTVDRTYYDAPSHMYNRYRITSAKRRGSDTIEYDQVWNFEGTPANKAAMRVHVVLTMVDGKFRVVSSRTSDGSYLVKDGKYPSDGGETPLQNKCPAK